MGLDDSALLCSAGLLRLEYVVDLLMGVSAGVSMHATKHARAVLR